MANPSHLSVFFARTVRVRKEHILGEPASEGHDLMKVINRGETRKIQFGPAMEMVVAESVLEDKTVNREKIDAIRAEIRAEQENTGKKLAKAA